MYELSYTLTIFIIFQFMQEKSNISEYIRLMPEILSKAVMPFSLSHTQTEVNGTFQVHFPAFCLCENQDFNKTNNLRKVQDFSWQSILPFAHGQNHEQGPHQIFEIFFKTPFCGNNYVATRKK